MTHTIPILGSSGNSGVGAVGRATIRINSGGADTREHRRMVADRFALWTTPFAPSRDGLLNSTPASQLP